MESYLFWMTGSQFQFRACDHTHLGLRQSQISQCEVYDKFNHTSLAKTKKKRQWMRYSARQQNFLGCALSILLLLVRPHLLQVFMIFQLHHSQNTSYVIFGSLFMIYSIACLLWITKAHAHLTVQNKFSSSLRFPSMLSVLFKIP